MKSLKEEITSTQTSLSSFQIAPDSAKSTMLIELMEKARVGALKGSDLARRIDHTLLKAEATASEIDRICEEARLHRFASVCVNTGRIARVARALKGSDSLPIAVVGFPLGAMSTAAKTSETEIAIAAGAREIDMVLSIGDLKDRNYEAVFEDIQAVVKAAGTAPVKVILETCLLTDGEKIAACVIAKRAGARFVKTSTGFSKSGATTEDIRLMRAVVGSELGVKASGGIRTREDALKMIAAGADRIGASASVAIASDSIPTEKTSTPETY